MKIQVGKTYKDTRGESVYIEARHSRTKAAGDGFPYYGSYVDGSTGNFSDEGRARGCITDLYNLLPNKVTVTKYSWMYEIGDVSHSSSALFGTKEKRDKVMNTLSSMYTAISSTVTYEIEE